jgi:hypothetical protein
MIRVNNTGRTRRFFGEAKDAAISAEKLGQVQNPAASDVNTASVCINAGHRKPNLISVTA